MRVVIVDDEPLAREGLRAMLERAGGIEIVGMYATADAARPAIRAHTPDAVFLDMEMPGASGLDLVRTLAMESPPLVVAVTAHERFAPGAFDVDVIDYVLKPVDEARLGIAIDRVRAALSLAARAAAHDRVVAAVDATSSLADTPAPAAYSTRLATRLGDRLVVLRLADVSWIEADGDYMRVYHQGKAALVRSTMSDLERRLDPATFVRVHRSAIVNLDAVSSVDLLAHGDSVAVLTDGSRVRVGRSYKSALLATLGDRG